MLHPDRLFPVDENQKKIAREIYAETKSFPILSPHGHTDPKWFANDHHFSNPTELIFKPDHYIFRMLYSQGVSMQQMGFDSQRPVEDREVWKLFARYFYLFRGTPSWIWLNTVFFEVFQMEQTLSEQTADFYFEQISEQLQKPEFSTRSLFKRFNIELISTTDAATDSLSDHQSIRDSGWGGRVLPCFRPDAVVDPENENFDHEFSQLTQYFGQELSTFNQYLYALRQRREFFKAMGATATDHGHVSAVTLDLSEGAKEALYQKIRSKKFSREEAEAFRAQMLTEMAAMSIDDGLVMQLHPGSYRNHNTWLFEKFGRDVGADIPLQMEFTKSLRPLLNKFGNHPEFSLIVFTLDESTYSRELAPLAGHYPALKLGPAWWFHDSFEGMMRFRENMSETAGFYNTVGFNDDTRAYFSIPARHDVARRVDAHYLSKCVAEHRMRIADAVEVAKDLAYHLPKKVYKL